MDRLVFLGGRGPAKIKVDNVLGREATARFGLQVSSR